MARLANSLGRELGRAEAQKGADSNNPDAIDLIMRGWAAIGSRRPKQALPSAHDYFERAMKLDPQNADAIDRLRLRWSPRGEGGDKAGEVEKFHQNGRPAHNERACGGRFDRALRSTYRMPARSQ